MGLAIKKTENGDFHSGVFYDSGCEGSFIHLAGENIRVEAPKAPYKWVISGIDDSVKKSIAGMCSIIANARPDIPYAFDRAGWRFDSAGVLISGPNGKGMTCATFILAIFEAISHPLLREDEWPRGTEQADKWAILSTIFQADRADSEHANLAMNDTDAPRIRPPEVVSASAATQFPVPYKRAKKSGVKLEKELAKAG